MVEMDIFYVAIYPERKDVIFNLPWLIKQPNILTDLVPDGQKYKKIVIFYSIGLFLILSRIPWNAWF